MLIVLSHKQTLEKTLIEIGCSSSIRNDSGLSAIDVAEIQKQIEQDSDIKTKFVQIIKVILLYYNHKNVHDIWKLTCNWCEMVDGVFLMSNLKNEKNKHFHSEIQYFS